MSDFDPAAWIAAHEALPKAQRDRKAEVMRAALAEVGSGVELSPLGGVWTRGRPADDLPDFRAHEIGCRAIGLDSLPFDEWRAMVEHLNRELRSR